MFWQKHYTGISVAEPINFRPSNIRFCVQAYLQRDHAQRLRMVRLSGWHWTVGLFIGHGNYLGHLGLFEVFTTGIHFGALRHSRWGVEFSGSMRDSRASYTLFCGRVAVGSTTDKWLKRWLDAREARKYAEMPDFDDVPF